MDPLTPMIKDYTFEINKQLATQAEDIRRQVKDAISSEVSAQLQSVIDKVASLAENSRSIIQRIDNVEKLRSYSHANSVSSPVSPSDLTLPDLSRPSPP